MKKQPFVLTELSCDSCNLSMTIPRKLSKQKKTGHIKHMYCSTCQTEQAFIEGVKVDKNIMFWEQWHAQFQ